MNLYHFNPNGYGRQWFVMAESRDAAIEAVRASIRAEVATQTYWDNAPDEWPDPTDPRNGQTAGQKRAEELTYQLNELERYVNGEPSLKHNPSPSIEVLGPNQVVVAEIC